MLEDDDISREKSYPFAFRFTVGYLAAGDTLSIAYTVTNTGDEVLPASMGAHPAFAWPLAEGIPKEAHFLEFGADEPGPIRGVQDGLLLGKTRPSPIRDRVLPLREELFASDALILDPVQSRRVRFAAAGGPSIERVVGRLPGTRHLDAAGRGFPVHRAVARHGEPGRVRWRVHGKARHHAAGARRIPRRRAPHANVGVTPRKIRTESKGRSAGTSVKAHLPEQTQPRTNEALAMSAHILDTAAAETLCFGYGDTALGTILVAESARGVVALFIGDDRARLLRDLQDAFPEAEFVPDQAGLAQTIVTATALVDAPHIGTDLALDLRGSPLEVAVWHALRAIPAGETRSYGAIAHSLPLAATAQEVGAACAANRIAVAVPCHRVVKADGSISGYRWGVQRKRRLINLEGIA